MGWRVSWYQADKENPVIVEENDEGDGVLYSTGKINGKQVMNNQGTDIWIELKTNNEDFKKEIEDTLSNWPVVTNKDDKTVVFIERE